MTGQIRRYHDLQCLVDRLTIERSNEFDQDSTTAQLARRFDVTPTTIQRWRRTGVPWYQADRIATRCGFHPVQVWPDFHD